MTLLLQIPYDKTEGSHNLIGLVRPVAAYTTHFGAEFSKTACVGTYNTKIYDKATAVVRARTEASHKAKCADRGTDKTARRETEQFILTVIEDTWVRELRDPEMFYTDVVTKALLDHLQAG